MVHPREEVRLGPVGLLGLRPRDEVPRWIASSDLLLVVLRDLPVFMAAGTEDRLVPLDRAEACAACPIITARAPSARNVAAGQSRFSSRYCASTPAARRGRP